MVPQQPQWPDRSPEQRGFDEIRQQQKARALLDVAQGVGDRLGRLLLCANCSRREAKKRAGL